MKKAILLLSFTVIVTTAFSQTNKLMEKVTFKNKNLNMSGILHLPENMEQGKKYPAIIFIHPGGGVKEQTAGLYASKMAQKGFIGLAFDASYQGESEGEPRFLEDPNARVEDYDYYRTPRAQHPNSKNLIMLTSLDRLYAFDAFANISTYLTQPLLMIVGSEAVDSRWHGERAVKETAGQKELMVIEGATHVSLYDRPQYVEPIVEKLTIFFGENLK